MANGGTPSFENLARESESVFCGNEVFDGLRLMFGAPIQQTSFGVTSIDTHWMLGGSQNPQGSFLFGTSLASQTMQSVFRLNPADGTVQGSIFKVFPNRVTFKMQSQSQGTGFPMPPAMMANLELEKTNDDSVVTAKCMNDQVLIMQYTQRLTSALVTGAEVMLRRADYFSSLSGSARYTEGNGVATASMDSEGEMSATYTQKIDQQTAVSTELQVNRLTRASVARMGYEVKVKNTSVKAQVDTNYRSAVVASTFVHICSLNLSGQFDYASKEYKFGIGLTIG